MPAHDGEETAADIARRRLAELAANFNASLPEPEHELEENVDSDTVGKGTRSFTLGSSHVKFLMVLGAGSVFVLAWWLFSTSSAGAGAESPSVAFSATSTSQSAAGDGTVETETASIETLIVHVVGKVKRPGIVTVPAGSRVADAIEAAGGVRGKVDLADLNLARAIADGEQIRVGLDPAVGASLGSGQTSADPSAPAGQGAGLININTAGATELETLPGVGPVTAQAILDWRTKNQRFATIEDLLDVRGIGEATLERLRPLVSL